MKKAWLFSGVILLLTGLIVTTALAAAQRQTVVSSRVVDARLDASEGSGDFSQGSRLRVTVSPGDNWGMLLEKSDEYNFDHVAISVTIVDPYGMQSELEAVFVSPPTSQGYSTQGLTLFLVKLVSNNGGLTFERSNEKAVTNAAAYYSSISAIVNFTGSYHVSIDAIAHSLDLYEETLSIEHPYLFLVPAGATLAAAGAVLSVLAVRRDKPRRSLRTGKIRLGRAANCVCHFLFDSSYGDA